MASMTYIGLDVHKKTVVWCAKTAGGKIKGEGTVAATRAALTKWSRQLDGPWTGAMEATIFTGWIYDHLKPRARELKVAHPLMLRAIAAAKKKNDQVDARMLAVARKMVAYLLAVDKSGRAFETRSAETNGG